MKMQCKIIWEVRPSPRQVDWLIDVAAEQKNFDKNKRL